MVSGLNESKSMEKLNKFKCFQEQRIAQTLESIAILLVLEQLIAIGKAVEETENEIKFLRKDTSRGKNMGLAVMLIEKKASKHVCICSDCGTEHTTSYPETLFSKSITHNLTKMAEEAGIYGILWHPETNGIETASDMIPELTEGLRKLIEDPIKFQVFNPENGWGSYNVLVKFVDEYLQACLKHRDAIVVADR